jgi:hypothetical protein
MTNKPLRKRFNQNTAAGRRSADLFRAYLSLVDNPDDTMCRPPASTLPS